MDSLDPKNQTQNPISADEKKPEFAIKDARGKTQRPFRVVVVHGDPETREYLVESLKSQGFDTDACGGPNLSETDNCPVLHHCGCPECELGDAMVYDPCLLTQKGQPVSERILYRLREWYPEKPVFVLNRGDNLTPELVLLLAEDTGIQTIADDSPEVLASALREALQAR